MLYPTTNTFHKPTSPATSRYRLISASVALAGISLFFFARHLQPDPSGIGTHQQLHLPSCAFNDLTGYPCPTCGMTTAFVHVARGQFASAFIVQPAGAMLAIGLLLATILATYAAITGQTLQPITCRINWIKLTVAIFVATVAAWLWLCLIIYVQNY